MTLRNYPKTDARRDDKLFAHSILDAVKGGADIEHDEVVWALTTLGETIE